MITTTFALRNKKTLSLLKLELNVITFEDGGTQTEREYTVEPHGDLPIWETDNLSYAVLAKNGYPTYSSLELPALSCIKPDEVEVVAVHRLNGTHKVITSDNIPQSIFEFISDMEEYIKLRYADQQGNASTNDYALTLMKYKEDNNSFKIDSYTFTTVWNILDNIGKIPKIIPDKKLFIISLNETLKLLKDI